MPLLLRPLRVLFFSLMNDQDNQSARTETVQHRTKIRSFVRREGRFTLSQKQALEENWKAFGIEYDKQKINFPLLFGRHAYTVLEIGFGNGQTLTKMAATYPEINYLGIEVHRPGVGQLLKQLRDEEINNVRIMTHDAKDVLINKISDASLDALYLFFPDPWPKSKHHKRRLVQTDFVQLIATKLKIGGLFHVATDWQDYARHILKVMTVAETFQNTAGTALYVPCPEYRSLTKFEQRGQKLGYQIRDMVFERV